MEYPHLKDRPISDASWITTTDFQCLNPDLYEHYQALHSLGSSFSKAGKTGTGQARSKSTGPDP